MAFHTYISRFYGNVYMQDLYSYKLLTVAVTHDELPWSLPNAGKGIRAVNYVLGIMANSWGSDVAWRWKHVGHMSFFLYYSGCSRIRSALAIETK